MIRSGITKRWVLTTILVIALILAGIASFAVFSIRGYYYDYVGLPEEFVRRNHALNWIGPTRVWISIGIELFSRKREK